MKKLLLAMLVGWAAHAAVIEWQATLDPIGYGEPVDCVALWTEGAPTLSITITPRTLLPIGSAIAITDWSTFKVLSEFIPSQSGGTITYPWNWAHHDWPAVLDGPDDTTIYLAQLAGQPIRWQGTFSRVPEPSGALLFGLGLAAYAVRRRARQVAVLAFLGLLCATPVFSADDDPTPIQTVPGNVTVIEPAGFQVTLLVTPVVKVQGTNTANVTKILVSKLQDVRTMTDGGVQIGQTRREVIGTRDATYWMFNRTNVNGRVALNINDTRGSWAASAWNNALILPEEP